jgi:hypothetical protein
MEVVADLLTVGWPGTTERLDLATGRSLPAVPTADGVGRVVAQSAGLTVTRSRKTLHTNPFRWGELVTILALVEDRTGRRLGQVVSRHALELLRLERGALVVRDGDRVVRFTIDDPR